MRAHASAFAAECADLVPPDRSRVVAHAGLQSAEFYPHIDSRDRDAAPNTVIYVESTDEVGRLLRLAYERDQPIYVRQGSGQVSIDHPTPFPPGVVLVDLRRLRKFAVDKEAGLLDVGPAVTLHETNRQLAGLGYEFPLSVGPVTWGGLVSTNTSGHLVDARSGKPGDYVMGMTVVLPDGTVVTTGTRAQRKLTGPDLTRVFIGGQCLFGVITELTLRLPTAPAARSFGWASFETLASVAESVRGIYTERLPLPHLGELVGVRYARVSGIEELTAPGELVLLGTAAEDQSISDSRLDTLLDHMRRRHGGTVGRVSADEWARIWKIRESPHAYINGTYLIGEVIDTPLPNLGDTLAGVQRLRVDVERDWPGVEAYLWGHIGAGSVHPAFSCDKSWTREQMAEAAADIRQRVDRLRMAVDGSCGEQGIYPEHATWFVDRFGSATHAVNGAMKRAFDPKNLLNPERLVGQAC